MILERVLRQLEASPDPDAAREYVDLVRADPGALRREGGPRHLTASGVVVDAPGEHLALVWHLKGRFWVQPGGHIEDADVDLEQAARREVAEEIGLRDLERVGPGPALLHRHALDSGFGACTEHWDVQYLLRAPLPAGELPLAVSEESGAVRWAPLADLPEGTVSDMPEKLARLRVQLEAHPRQA
ncbi:NUDIX hydrolase [Brachybacterium sp. DNPG3]